MRLLTNFGAARDYQTDFNAARRPITIIAAADDELMFSDKYAEAVRGTTATTTVRVLDHAGHMDVVTKRVVIARVADIIVEEIAK
jgi:pimeloyl-ACP methyl ester carboxylesterase